MRINMMSIRQTVDVIIPTYKPDEELVKIIELLENQTVPIHKLIIMNTEEKYFYKLFYGTGFLERYKNIEIHHISALEFDHGKTRRKAAGYSEADIFVCMTQDALPADTHLIEALTDSLGEDDKIAVAYARQLPRKDCREIERYTREFNYPEQSAVKSADDIPTLGIKTFFCSNVCAAYRRDIYDELGGFVKRAIFNEDMIYAGGAVKSGYKVAYVSQAQVYHSHNYTCKQQFRRNFDLGVSQAQHPEIFDGISSENEGIKLIRQTAKHLADTKNLRYIPYLFVSSAYKYLGYKFGINYKKLPYGMIEKCSASSSYWKV